MKTAINPMQLERLRAQAALMHQAPRCSARSKRSGQPCRAPAVKGWRVCRVHGARGGAPKGKRNGNWRHGGCTNEIVELRRAVSELLREARGLPSGNL